jgi:hypothetical protein
VAVVLAGMAGSVLVAQESRSTVTRQRVERLDRTATARTITITDAMANYENALQAARSLWLASNSVSRSEFNAFARSLDLEDRYPGLQGIGWRSLVTDGGKAEFVARSCARMPRWPSGAGTSSAGPPGSSGPATSWSRRCGPRSRAPAWSCTTPRPGATP